MRAAKELRELNGVASDEAAAEMARKQVEFYILLRDAAVSGVVLSFNPQDSEMREKAQRSWNRIRALLAQRVLGGDESSVPWTANRPVFSGAAAERLKRRYAELRALARRIDAVSFEYGRSKEVADAAEALREIAIKLDDLIDGEEESFLPTLRRFVFAHPDDAAAVGKAVGC